MDADQRILGPRLDGPKEIRVESLDDRLQAQITYSGNLRDNLTILVVAGLGVREGVLERKARRAVRRAQKQGVNVNVATFVYRSHQHEPLSGFENDREDLETVTARLLKMGVSPSRFGFFSVCYGAHVLGRYLQDHPDAGFVIMIEPFLGPRGLKLPVWALGRVALAYHRWLGKPWVWARVRPVDAGSLLKVIKENIRLDHLKIPILGISNRVHRVIFDVGYLRTQLGAARPHTELDGRILSKNTVTAYYALGQEFLLHHQLLDPSPNP